MALSLVTAPAEEPITLDEAKAQLSLTGITAWDTLLPAQITAARLWVEDFTSRALVNTIYDLTLDAFPACGYIEVPRAPLVSVASVDYYDTANTKATMAVADYFVDTANEPGRIVLAYGKTWPSTTLRPANGVIVRFTAGYGDGADHVPENMKAAVKLLVGNLFRNRESLSVEKGLVTVADTKAIEALLWPLRVWTRGSI